MEETRVFSRKSPLVFGESLWIREKTDFCCRKISLIRNIVLIFALDKTQLSFFLPPSGVYHSVPRRTSSDASTQTIFDLLNRGRNPTEGV